MKKILLSLTAFIFLALGVAAAQDMAKATEVYNEGATALMANKKAEALDHFQEALKLGEACGEEGKELVANCKNTIPGLILSIAKDFLRKKDYVQALPKIEQAIAKAKEYDKQDVVKEGEELLSQAKFGQELDAATELLKKKDFKAACESLKKLLEANPTNSDVALLLGQAYGKVGDFASAEKAYNQAAENGAKEVANKQLSKMYLTKANALNKAKKYPEVVMAAQKAISFNEDAKAYFIMANAYQKLNKNAEALKAFETYLNLDPKASNAAAIQFTVAALYQQMGNKAKAIEYYKKVQSHPQFGPQAKEQIKALSK